MPAYGLVSWRCTYIIAGILVLEWKETGAVWISRPHACAYFMAVIIFVRCLNAASVASYKRVDRLD